MAGVAQSSRYYLGAAVMAIETRLGDYDAQRGAHGRIESPDPLQFNDNLLILCAVKRHRR